MRRAGALDTGAIIVTVEKRVNVYRSFDEADKADAARDKALTPEERINITIELRNQRHPDAAQQRLARVYRVTKLERS
jgi:hypothetical protein